ncbi:ComEA family DNA-binding protein [Streptomyces sp. NBC_01016]|uniref:ComEA family DNA-binding protein n=1 Tax=Streptomyces sp. NBC_01016 TaxID=2903720 RepID=UPI002256ED63|nr:ComEA family DNA-binding protein [Streptomyces sp. NBC_01016]MCX4832633.1 ComEA family DNA-binding protein [Streptomyces sp. NBC_01016]
MELRSRTRTAHASSGPGRGPASDSRARQRHVVRRRARRRRVEAERTRVRAEALFAPPGALVEPVQGSGSAQGQASGLAQDRDLAPSQGPAPAQDQGPAPSRRERAAFALRDRLPLWVQTRCGVERRGALALAVLVGVVGLFAVQHFWAGRTQPVRAPETVRAAAPRAVGPPGGGASPAAVGQGPGSGPGLVASGATGVVVDVSGKVRRPGIQRLPAGARVADALRAAGGLRPGTDTEGLNRARLLVDGEQVVVGAPAAAAAAAPSGAPVGASAPAGPIGLNTATLEQLDTLPGVGPVLAQHIVDYRTEHGGFRSVDELREVNGIGDRRFEDLQNAVRP